MRGRAMDICHLEFREAFNAVSCKIFTKQLKKVWNRNLSGNLINIHKYYKRVCEEDEPRLSSGA